MIKQISVNSVNSVNNNVKNQPQFKGGPLDALVSAVQLCEANPMLNVAVLDLSTAIIPRTIVESETNPYAGFEAFRRESSGLIINCMIPGLIVAAIAKGIGGLAMGGKTGMSNCWANEDTINMVTDYWKKAQGSNDREKVADTFRQILKDSEGIDGENTIKFNDFNFEESVQKLTDEVMNPKPKAKFLSKEWKENRTASKKLIKEAYSAIVNQTHAAENIKINGHGEGYFSQSLGSIIDNTPKILKELINGKNVNVSEFAQKATKLVTAKSLLGLGVIIPLAISAQPINRWITAKTSGKNGAPIYKDFTQSESQEKTPQEKAALFRQKLISAGCMIGVAMLSIMKKPEWKMLKNISQFKGIFPSMDQARIISTATFASRMMASQDKNDLREATVRDIATFSAFYFLGDYVAKGIGTGIQAWSKKRGNEIKLINILKEPDKNANRLKKFWYWAKNTALKSSDEVFGKTVEATKYAKKMRSVCQLGNIAFSLLALGILIPKMNRKKTDKEREAELKRMGIDSQIISKYYPTFALNMAGNHTKDVYKPFLDSKT